MDADYRFFLHKEQECSYFDETDNVDLEEYAKIFDGAATNQVTVDVTPSYMANARACERLSTSAHLLSPKVRFMVVLRNPIERSFSNYLQRVRNGKTDRSFIEDVRSMDTATYAASMYYDLISRWNSRVNANVEIALFDDIVEDPMSVLAMVGRLCELDSPVCAKYAGINVNSGELDTAKAWPKFRRYLGSHLRSLGLNPLIHWLKVNPIIRQLDSLNSGKKPSMTSDEYALALDLFRPQVELLDEAYPDLKVLSRWKL